MVDTETHFDVLRGYLRRYPDALIFEWLAELEEIGLLESHPGEQAHDLDFTGSFPLPRLIAEDQARVAKDTVAAGGALQRKGVYLAADRLKHGRLRRRHPRYHGADREDDPTSSCSRTCG